MITIQPAVYALALLIFLSFAYGSTTLHNTQENPECLEFSRNEDFAGFLRELVKSCNIKPLKLEESESIGGEYEYYDANDGVLDCLLDWKKIFGYDNTVNYVHAFLLNIGVEEIREYVLKTPSIIQKFIAENFDSFESSAEERSLLLFAEDLYHLKFEKDHASAWLALRNVLPSLDLQGEVRFREVILKYTSSGLLPGDDISSLEYKSSVKTQAEYYQSVMERFTDPQQPTATFSRHLTLCLLEALASDSPHSRQFGEFSKSQADTQEMHSLKIYPVESSTSDAFFDHLLEKYMLFSQKAATEMILHVLVAKIPLLDPSKLNSFTTKDPNWSVYFFLEIEAVRALRKELRAIFETRTVDTDSCAEAPNIIQQAWAEVLQLLEKTEQTFPTQKKLKYTLRFLRQVGPEAFWNYAQANPYLGTLVVYKNLAKNLAEDFMMNIATRLYREQIVCNEAVRRALETTIPECLEIDLGQSLASIISACEQFEELLQHK